MKFNKRLEEIETYEAGKPIELVVREFGIEPEDIIKLASNENPNGCSPKVQEAVTQIVGNMSLYPDDSMMQLKNGLASKYEVEDKNIIIGSGSDQVIEFIMHAKADENSKILINSVTFAMYAIYAKHVGATVIRTASQEHNLDAFYRLYQEEHPDIIFICTPNNPTGDAIDAEKLMEFLAKIDAETLVVIDGAYMEYCAFKDAKKRLRPQELIARFCNVIYLGTFSKAYGLGGMRVGYGIADAKIIEALYKLRPPFNVTTLSLEAASVALEDEAFVDKSVALCFDEMQRYEAFAKEHNIETIESYTNFITLCFDRDQNSTKISDALLKKGVIVRDLSGYGMNAIRVTIGTPEQNSRFFACISELL